MIFATLAAGACGGAGQGAPVDGGSCPSVDAGMLDPSCKSADQLDCNTVCQKYPDIGQMCAGNNGGNRDEVIAGCLVACDSLKRCGGGSGLGAFGCYQGFAGDCAATQACVNRCSPP